MVCRMRDSDGRESLDKPSSVTPAADLILAPSLLGSKSDMISMMQQGVRTDSLAPPQEEHAKNKTIGFLSASLGTAAARIAMANRLWDSQCLYELALCDVGRKFEAIS